MSEQRIEIQEAIDAGNRALQLLSEVEAGIGTAKGLGIWDMLGGGLFSGMLKHSKLDGAQRKMELARVELERFNRELHDVNMSYHAAISFDGFTRFADYFFDNIFVDFLVQDKIVKTQQEIQQIISQVQDTLRQLNNMLGQY